MPGARELIGGGSDPLTLQVEEVMAFSVTDLPHLALMGSVRGDGVARIGDLAVGNGEEYQISGVEKFKQRLDVVSAQEGAVAVQLATDADSVHRLVGREVQFVPRPKDLPTLADGRYVVPDQAVLVGISGPSNFLPGRLGVLILDGMSVRLLDFHRTILIAAPGAACAAGLAGDDRVALRGSDGVIRYLRGPQPIWAKHRLRAKLTAPYPNAFMPDPMLLDDASLKRAGRQRQPSRALRAMWAPVLVKMLRTRGVAVLDAGSETS